MNLNNYTNFTKLIYRIEILELKSGITFLRIATLALFCIFMQLFIQLAREMKEDFKTQVAKESIKASYHKNHCRCYNTNPNQLNHE